MTARSARVSPQRLPGWLDRFAASHGSVKLATYDGGLRLAAADGTTALLQLGDAYPHPAVAELLERTASLLRETAGTGTDATAVLADLAAIVEVRIPTGIILIRRGGYAVGVAEAGKLTASKTGTRYVQSRTAAGGWSQQRFARRRANQADALVGSAAAQAQRVIGASGVGLLVFGGDKALCAEAAGTAELAGLAQLPRLAFLDVPDPRLKVLELAAQTLNSVRIEVTDG